MIYLLFSSQSTTILYTIFIMAAYNSKGGNCLAATYKCIHQQLQSSKTGQHVATRVHKNGWLEQECVTQQKLVLRSKLLNRAKIEHMITCLATLAYVYAAACAIHVTIFSTGGKFRLAANFTELHTLTLAIPVLMCFWFASIG